MTQPAKINLAQWAKRYAELKCAGLDEPSYGGPIERHLADGDLRLRELHFDNSAAALVARVFAPAAAAPPASEAVPSFQSTLPSQLPCP